MRPAQPDGFRVTSSRVLPLLPAQKKKELKVLITNRKPQEKPDESMTMLFRASSLIPGINPPPNPATHTVI